MKKIPKAHTYSTLISDLASLIEQGRKAAVRYVNTALVATYWLIGRRIVEYEQKGKERAEYGEALLKNLAKDLSPKYGKGFCERNLELMRKFYLTYSISQTLSAKSKKGYTLCSELESKQKIIHYPSNLRFRTRCVHNSSSHGHTIVFLCGSMNLLKENSMKQNAFEAIGQ